MSGDGTERLKFLSNNEIREEIVSAVGGESERYRCTTPPKMLTKTHMEAVAEKAGVANNDCDIESLTLKELQLLVCQWVGTEEAACISGIKRPGLKQIHRAVCGGDPEPTESDEEVAA